MRITILAFSDWRIQEITDVLSFVQDLKEPVDFILYGGDDIGRFEEEGINYFTELSDYTKQRKVLAVIGNDDFPEEKKVLASKNVHDLHEKPFIFKEFGFIGLEASTSGPAIVRHTEKEVEKHLKKQYGQVKGKSLIILSHTPPYGILDLGIRFAELDEGSHHIGSKSLKEFIQRNKVNLVVCGHCHSHGRLSTQFEDTTVVNVSSHDSYGAKGNFALVEIDTTGYVSIEWHDTFEKQRKTSLMHLDDVGAARQSMLHRLGIKTIRDLAEARNLGEIVTKSSFSESFLKKLQLGAKSVLENKTYQLAPFVLPECDLIFFDIETDIARSRVWLIGALKEGKFTRFYADNWKQERRILKDFLRFLEENPNSVLVSYSGSNFDRNVLLRSLNRLGLNSDLFFSYPHIDLCRAFKRSFTFPNQSFALKDLASHLKYPFKHPDLDGFLVALEYQRHLKERTQLDPRVLDYNEDDVNALPFMIRQITERGFAVEKRFLEKAYPTRIEPLKDVFSKGELITMARDYYGKFGYISVRKDKRYNSYNVVIRLYGKTLEDLSPIRHAMANLGFSEGTPYQDANKRRCYIPYYGREQAIRFIEMMKPRVKKDLSKLR